MVLGGLVSTGGSRTGLGSGGKLLSVCTADVAGEGVAMNVSAGVAGGVAGDVVSPADWLAIVSEGAASVAELPEEPGETVQAESNRTVSKNGNGISFFM